MKHLAIFSNKIGDLVLSGVKTVDFRFSKAKISPYLKVQKGDIVLIQNVSELVKGQAEVENVLYFDNLNTENIQKIKKEYLTKSALNEEQFLGFSRGARYLSIILLCRPQHYIAPLRVQKNSRSGWLSLN